MIKRLLLSSLLCLLLSSCALLRTHNELNNRLEITAGQWMQLPSPAELGLNLTATQILTASYKETHRTAQVQVEATKKKLVIVALGGWSSEVFSVVYDGRTLKTSSLPMPKSELGVTHAFTDFIFSYAPANVLRRLLASTTVKLVLKPKKRIFTVAGMPIITIDYQNLNPWVGKIKLHNLKLGYTVSITTVSVKKLGEAAP